MLAIIWGGLVIFSGGPLIIWGGLAIFSGGPAIISGGMDNIWVGMDIIWVGGQTNKHTDKHFVNIY